MADTKSHPAPPIREVVVVDAHRQSLRTLDRTFGANRFRALFVESGASPYSRIKSARPDMIVLCARIDDPGAFHLLTMLALDGETRGIPVVTLISGHDGDEPDDTSSQFVTEEAPLPSSRTAISMN